MAEKPTSADRFFELTEERQFELLIDWVIACCRSVGCPTENLDIVEGFQVVAAALNAFPPRIASLQSFYKGLFAQEDWGGKLKEIEPPTTPLKAGLRKTNGKYVFGDNIQSAEQYEALAKAGFVVDKRKER